MEGKEILEEDFNIILVLKYYSGFFFVTSKVYTFLISIAIFANYRPARMSAVLHCYIVQGQSGILECQQQEQSPVQVCKLKVVARITTLVLNAKIF